MDMNAAFQEVGSYRAAAAICGTTDKTVKRAVAKARAAEAAPGTEVAVAHNYDDVATIIAERVERTDGRISAKRLLPVVRAAGYTARPATCAGRWPRPRRSGAWTITGAVGPGCGRRATCWCSTGARSARSSCSAPCWPGADSASCTSPTTSARRPPWRHWPSAWRRSGRCPRPSSPIAWVV